MEGRGRTPRRAYEVFPASQGKTFAFTLRWQIKIASKQFLFRNGIKERARAGG
jgi:hypothetical protein